MSLDILIGCDVDPVLPARLDRPPGGDIWAVLDRIPELVRRLGADQPPVTWLMRADESIRFATGVYASAYVSRRSMWTGLVRDGHELGWHMHLLSRNATTGEFEFDPRPAWLGDAHESLARHFRVRATRTGWDYADAFLFAEFERLGVELDFSALPGNRVWSSAGQRQIVIDWLGTPPTPYHPDRNDHRRPGPSPLRLVEVPVAQFPNSWVGQMTRLAWRLRHGCFSLSGLANKTREITERWDGLPRSSSGLWAFHFHPEELTDEGIRNFAENVARLRLAGAKFLTAGEAIDGMSPGPR